MDLPDTTDCAINIKQLAKLLCETATEASPRDDFDACFATKCGYDALADLCRLMAAAIESEHEEAMRAKANPKD